MANNKREYRASGESSVVNNTLTGYIAVFNTISGDLGGFKEKLAPGCFTTSLRTSDIRGLINHDTNAIIGRTGAGTLKLFQDDKGLGFTCDLPDTQAARDLKVSVERKDLTGNSFGFRCVKDSWQGNVRTVEDLQLFEVSVGVTFPAYEASSMSLRQMFPDGDITPPSEDDADNADTCGCPCAQCQAGSCGICSNDNCDDDNCNGCTNQSDDIDDDDVSDDSEFNSNKAIENLEISDDAEWKGAFELRLRLRMARAKSNK